MSKKKTKKASTPKTPKTPQPQQPPKPTENALADMLFAIPEAVDNFTGPDGMPNGVKTVLKRFPDAASDLVTALPFKGPGAPMREAAIAEFSTLADDVLKGLANPRMGEDELHLLKNRVIAGSVRARAFGSASGRPQPKEALRAMMDFGTQFDKGIASMILKSGPTTRGRALQLVDFDELFKEAMGATDGITLGERLATRVRSVYPKLDVALELRGLPRQLADAARDPAALKAQMSEAVARLTGMGATQQQVKNVLAGFAREHGLPDPDINSAGKASGASSALKRLFTTSEGKISKSRLAGAAGLGLLALWGVKKLMGSDKPVEAAPPPRAPTFEEDAAQALMNPLNPGAGANILALMKMNEELGMARGEQAGMLRGLADRRVLEPITRARFSRSEIPLSAMLTQAAYEQQENELQNPQAADMRAALAGP